MLSCMLLHAVAAATALTRKRKVHLHLARSLEFWTDEEVTKTLSGRMSRCSLTIPQMAAGHPTSWILQPFFRLEMHLQCVGRFIATSWSYSAVSTTGFACSGLVQVALPLLSSTFGADVE